MSRASRARAIAQAAAVGGAGLVGAGGAFYGLLIGQARLARHRIGTPSVSPPNPDARYGDGDGEALRLAVLGDSGAAGFGVETATETTGALVAAGLAAALGKPVDLRSVAVVGALSGDLQAQVDTVVPWQPHVAVVMVGANDVTHKVTPGRSVALLASAVQSLLAANAAVVVGTCPDLGTVRPIPHPLRLVARRWSRSLAAAQTVAVLQAGGRTVALADLLGAEFDAHPDRMFGPDQFHPSPAGYRAVADALVPSLHAALVDATPDGDEAPTPVRTSVRPETVLAVDVAAAAAAEVGGTEVAIAAASDQPARRWGQRTLAAVLRRRDDTD